MRAFWWIIINFGILKVFPELSDQAAAYNRKMGSPIFGIGLVLFVLIWALVLSQATFTRVNRVVGYILLNVGIALSIFLAAATSAMFLDVVYAESRNKMPGGIAFLAGIGIAAIWLLWMVITLLRQKQGDSFTWGILENHKLVSADPARIEAPAEEMAYPDLLLERGRMLSQDDADA